MRKTVLRVVGSTLAALAVGVGLLNAGTAAAQAPPPVNPRRVVVVGDSIILGAKSQMVSAFEQQGFAVTFDAAVSRSTSAGASAVGTHANELTDSLVVNLGANDAGSPALFKSRVEKLLSQTTAVPHVYWLTIRESRPYYPGANNILREMQATHPNLTVVDWNAAAAAPGLTSSDGLHLTPGGAQAMTDLVVKQVTAEPVAQPAVASETSTTVAPTTVAPTSAAPASVAPSSLATTTTVATAKIDTAPQSSSSSSTSQSAEGDESEGWLSGPWKYIAGLVVLLIAGGGAVLALRTLRRSQTGTAPSGDRLAQRAERIAAARAEHGVPEPSDSGRSDVAADPNATDN